MNGVALDETVDCTVEFMLPSSRPAHLSCLRENYCSLHSVYVNSLRYLCNCPSLCTCPHVQSIMCIVMFGIVFYIFGTHMTGTNSGVGQSVKPCFPIDHTSVGPAQACPQPNLNTPQNAETVAP